MMKNKIFALVLALVMAFTLAACGGDSNVSQINGGENSPIMLHTKARVIEIYSPQSVLVEIIAELRYGADGKLEETALTERIEDNLFLVGEKVQAEFYSELELLNTLNTGDIIIIYRGQHTRA